MGFENLGPPPKSRRRWRLNSGHFRLETALAEPYCLFGMWYDIKRALPGERLVYTEDFFVIK
jgi:hypothetical protein